MKRICLFAGYDKTNIIQDYVVYYLKELSSVSDIYYMADNEISESEKLKIIPYVKGAYGFHHKKYDFGSWQELINIIGWEKILEYDELILANDSVFGPVYPMQEFMNYIENDREWDICGINKAVKYNIWHLSSYFLVFKKKVFNTNIFKTHIESVYPESKLADIVDKYEVPFMKKFYDNGFVVKCVLEKDVNVYDEWRDALNYGSPFIKVKGFLGNNTKIKDIIYLKNQLNYPLKLIKSMVQKRIIKNIRQNILRFHLGKGKTNIKILGISIIRHENISSNIIIDENNCPIKRIKSS